MRLIDAESPQNRIYVSDLVIEEMKKIPTVDIDRPTRSQFKRMAVQLGDEPVIYCKDCERWQKINDEMRKDGMCEALIDFHGADRYMTNENFFCAYGERRADEQ